MKAVDLQGPPCLLTSLLMLPSAHLGSQSSLLAGELTRVYLEAERVSPCMLEAVDFTGWEVSRRRIHSTVSYFTHTSCKSQPVQVICRVSNINQPVKEFFSGYEKEICPRDQPGPGVTLSGENMHFSRCVPFAKAFTASALWLALIYVVHCTGLMFEEVVMLFAVLV